MVNARNDSLEKLQEIHEATQIFNIVYRNAGVGIMFFEPGRIEDFVEDVPLDDQAAEVRNAWRDGLRVYNYYDTLDEAIDGEYRRVFADRPDMKIREVTECYLKEHMGLTNAIIAILSELGHEHGIGDKFINARAKKIGRAARPKVRQMIADCIVEEMLTL